MAWSSRVLDDALGRRPLTVAANLPPRPLGERGLGVRGDWLPRLPQPLSPEGRGGPIRGRSRQIKPPFLDTEVNCHDLDRASQALATVLYRWPWSGAAFGDPLVSGPQPGQKVPGPFFPLHVTGPDAGQQVCLYCKNGVNPVAMIFARELTPAVAELLTRIDAATVANQKADMGSFAVFLNDAKELPPALKQFADKQPIKTTILCTDAPAGPASYKIATDAEVTVVLYTHRTVKANYAFKKGELDAKATATILDNLAKILPKE